jgi:hypothetical protein
MYTYNVTKARSRNDCCPGKAISIKYSECLSAALVIQHAKRMRHITFSSVTSIVLPCLFTLYKKGTIFGKRVLNIKFVWFSLQLILRRIKTDIIINNTGLACKVPGILENCALQGFTQRVAVILVRSYETTYRSHPPGSRIQISQFSANLRRKPEITHRVFLSDVNGLEFSGHIFQT